MTYVLCTVRTGIIYPWFSCWHPINSLIPDDTLWYYWTFSRLVQVMACCHQATSHYLNQCWPIISEVQQVWKSHIKNSRSISPHPVCQPPTPAVCPCSLSAVLGGQPGRALTSQSTSQVISRILALVSDKPLIISPVSDSRLTLWFRANKPKSRD